MTYIYRTLKNNESEKDLQNEEMTSNWDQMVETFDELGLKKDLLRGIINYKIRYLWIRIRKAFSDSTKGHLTYDSRERRNCASAIWNR